MSVLLDNLLLEMRYTNSQIQFEVNNLKSTLRHIRSACGNPDAADACRQIIKMCDYALDEERE